MAQRLGDQSGIAQALISQCISLNRKGNSTDALALGLKALNIFEDIGMDSLIGYSCIHIAQVYKDIGGDKMTVEYLKHGAGLLPAGPSTVYTHQRYQWARRRPQ
jgi:hypothetical protein